MRKNYAILLFTIISLVISIIPIGAQQITRVSIPSSGYIIYSDSMKILSTCDNLTDWDATKGIVTNDYTEFIQGSASIVFEGDSVEDTGSVRFWASDNPIDFSILDTLKFSLRINELFIDSWAQGVSITIRDNNENWKMWTLADKMQLDVNRWLTVIQRVTESADIGSETPPDITNIQMIEIYFGFDGAGKRMWIDYLIQETYTPPPPPLQHNLNVDTLPSGYISFIIDGVEHTTPFSGQLDEGYHTISMPNIISIGTDEYIFNRWEDGTLGRSRTIFIDSNITMIAIYEPYVPPPPISALYTEGRWIKEKETGNTVFLRGVCQSGFLDAPDGWWTTLYIWDPNEVREHLQAMKTWGINSIRIMITAAWWIEDNVTFMGNSYSYRQNLKDTIQIAEEEGLYVILCGWMVLPIGEGSQTELPIPPHCTPEEQVYFPTTQSFVDYIVSQADELKDNPNVLLELWNEPVGDSNAKNDWFIVAQQCINEVRMISDIPIILHWGYCDVNDLISTIQNYPLNGTNLIWSAHIYRYHGTFDYDWHSPYDYNYIKEKLDACRRVGEELNLPLLIGEIGAYLWWGGQDWVEERAYFNNTLTILNEWSLSYTVWEWFPGGRPWSTYDANGSFTPNEVGQILINALAE